MRSALGNGKELRACEGVACMLTQIGTTTIPPSYKCAIIAASRNSLFISQHDGIPNITWCGQSDLVPDLYVFEYEHQHNIT
jgi:hypothetical protein